MHELLQTITKDELKEWFFKGSKNFYIGDLSKIESFFNQSTNLEEEKAEIIQRANRLLKNEFTYDEDWDMERCFTPYTLNEPIEWEKSMNGDPEWMWMLNRQRYFLNLAKAYVFTKDVAYFKKWLDLTLDWISYHKKPYETYRPTTSRTLDVGVRLKNWCACLDIFSQCKELAPLFSKEDLWTIVASLFQQVDFLEKPKEEDKAPLSNWKVLEKQGVVLTGLFFSSLFDVEDLLDRNLDILDESSNLQVDPDGYQWETSFMYHVEVYLSLLEVRELYFRQTGERLWDELLTKMSAAIIAYTKPDLTQSPVGDSDVEDLRELHTYTSLVLNSPEAKFLGEKILSPDAIFHYGSDIFVKYPLIKEQEPESNIQYFKETGYLYTRNNWSKDGIFTMLKATSLGGGHGHSDFGHFEIQAGSDYLLSDSGRFTYRQDSKWRPWFKNTTAHNCATVDNKEYIEQRSSWGFARIADDVPLFVNHKNHLTYAQAVHFGYFTKDQAIISKRHVFYLSETTFLVVDDFLTYEEGHSYQQHFNFPASALHVAGKSFEYKGEHHQLFLTPGYEEMEGIIEDSYYSPYYNEMVNSKKLAFHTTQPTLATLLTVDGKGEITLCPVTGNNDDKVTSEFVAGWKIKSKDFSGYVVLNHQENQSPRSNPTEEILGRKAFTVDGYRVYGKAAVIQPDEYKKITIFRS